ncbi:ArnT family glycosyltransferase [Actinomycetospora flava]|uniref:Phospholipid carrier-dependent glycosyltransferase n=1 Tax=Actinomycetospora flava TaxID=3129232 RepID=A0ABU8M412_9PSEU
MRDGHRTPPGSGRPVPPPRPAGPPTGRPNGPAPGRPMGPPPGRPGAQPGGRPPQQPPQQPPRGPGPQRPPAPQAPQGPGGQGVTPLAPGTPPPALGDPKGKKDKKDKGTKEKARTATPAPAGAPSAGTMLVPLASREKLGELTVGRAWPLTIAIGVVAFVIRAIGLGRANDLFVDELLYAQIGNSVADGHLPSFENSPFFLHPVGSFLLDAVFIKAFGLGSLPVMDLVYGLRWLTAILGAITVVLAFRLLRKVTPLPIALGGAAVLAFDPFVLRSDSRVMLETPATMWTLAAWLLLLGVLTNPADARVRQWREVGVGVVFGLALATKDMTVFQILVPLVLAIFWRRTLAAVQVGRIALGAAVPYVVFIAVIAANGLLGEFTTQKLSGVRRMFGIDQMTGFHASNVSLLDRLIAELSRFGTSYVLLGLCLFAGIGTVFAKPTGRRLMGLIGVSTGLFGVYAASAGALEEQFGYYTVVVSVVVCATAIAELRDRRPPLRRPLAVAGAVFVAATLVLGVTARLTVDDGFPQARAYLDTLPPDARVGLTGPVAQLAFLPRPNWGDWPSLTAMRDNDAQYVLTSQRPLQQGYGDAAPEVLTWLEQNAEPVFVAHGPSNGDTVVWKVDRAELDAAIAAGQDVPPVSESG